MTDLASPSASSSSYASAPEVSKPIRSNSEEVLSNDASLEKWRNRRFRWFYTPLAQIGLLGLVCFGCPGMFNALTGMGAGGQVSPTAANNGNIALYSTFAGFSIVAGGLNNMLGPSLTLAMGGCGYALYAGSLLATNIHGTDWDSFVIAAGAVLGVCAGMLWTAQGCVMMSYPKEKDKGKFIAMFWVIFNLGAVLGGALAFAINFDNNDGSVTNSTYVAFIVLMCIGAFLGLFLANPKDVYHPDQTPIHFVRSNSVLYEIKNLLLVFLDWRMLAMAPAILASNWFYTYQFNIANGATFDVRTRGLNSMLYWATQMFGALIVGWLILDNARLARRTRAMIAVGLVFTLNFSIWLGTYFQQHKFDRNDGPMAYDFDNSSTSGPLIFLYCLYGLLDAAFQTSIYWCMGALSNDAPTLARYAAFYKSVQSAGAAIAWSIDNHDVSYMAEMSINWALTSVGLILVFVVATQISDTEQKADELLADKQHKRVETEMEGAKLDQKVEAEHTSAKQDLTAYKAIDGDDKKAATTLDKEDDSPVVVIHT